MNEQAVKAFQRDVFERHNGASKCESISGTADKKWMAWLHAAFLFEPEPRKLHAAKLSILKLPGLTCDGLVHDGLLYM